MVRVFPAIVAAVLLSAWFVPTAPAPAGSGAVTLWEAYSQGHIAITQVDVTYDYGGQQFTNTLGYRVQNTGSDDVQINEFTMLLSPNPRQTSWGVTTQDGVLTKTTVPAGGEVTYMYGDMVAEGILPPPAWWCTEEKQFVQANVGIVLGGELLPFDLEALVQTMTTGPGGTQDTLWSHLRTVPTAVVGKTVDGAFWERIPETAGQSLTVVLHATNLAIKDTQDGLPDPDAPNAVVWDIVPAGYTIDAASITPGYTQTVLGDGSTRLSWNANLPAADVTNFPPGSVPTPYVSRAYTYRMTTPHIPPGDVILPRARVNTVQGFNATAQSAAPALEVYRVNVPPVPNAGGPYQGFEGSPITFNASLSTDPNGDPLRFRWDFTEDGTWDTAWSSSPYATFTFPDDFTGRARVEVTDGTFNVTADASVVIRNVAPTVDAGPAKAANEGSALAFAFTARDPGFDAPAMHTWENLTATVDWGYGPPESVPVVKIPGRAGVPTVGFVNTTHTYGDNGAFTITATVCDDDGGCGSDTTAATIANVAPTIAFTVVPTGGNEGDALTFQARATDPGSDDLTVAWDGSCTGWAAPTVYPNDPARFPDPFPSPEVNPRDVTDTQRVVCGDNGVFAWSLRVADDDGGVTTMSGTFSIANLPPSLTVSPPTNVSVDEGTQLALNATATDPGSDDLTFAWAWQYGPTESHVYYNNGVSPDPPNSPNGTYPFTASDGSSFTYGDNGAYAVGLLVMDDDGGFTTYATTVNVNNVPPTVTAGADATVDEASPVSVSFAFTDPGFNQPQVPTWENFTATVDWGYGPTEDVTPTWTTGSPGVPSRGSVDATHTYGDNGVFTVTATVCDDDGGCGSASLTVTVGNVAPTIPDVQAYVVANLTLRVAGEKWHDVRMDIVWNGQTTATARVVRYPGSPDRQSATITGGHIELLGNFSIILYYTPADDPINGQPNGANPVWVILTMPDGSEVRLHHTFNVQHPDTWTWTIDDVRPYLVGQDITFQATAHDVGSDDLTFAWTFGDGTAASGIYYNDGVGPDPYPSPEVNPITATDVRTHAYAAAGTYTVTLTVTDDDGGTASTAFTLAVGV